MSAAQDPVGVPPARLSLRAVVLLAALVPPVLLLLTRRPLWLDEAASATLAELPDASFRRVLLDREGNGLLHTVLLRGWQQLGLDDTAARVPSVVAGIAALVLLTVLADRLLGRRAALLVPPLLVTNPLFVRYVVEARSYALLLAFACASGLLLVRALQRQTVLAWSAYALVAGLAAYAHYFAVLMVVAHGVAVLVRRPLPRLLPLLPAGVLYLVVVSGLPRLMTDAAASGVGYLSGSPLARVLLPVLGVLASGALVAAALALRRGQLRSLRAAAEGWPLVLLVAWLVVPVALAVLLSVLRSPVLAPRYLMVCLPPAVLLAAAVLARLRPRLAVAVTGVVCAAGLVLGLAYVNDQSEAWDAAATTVQQAAQPGDEVLFVEPYVRIPFERHWDAARARADDVEPAYPALPWDADSARLFFHVPMPQAEVAAATADAARVLLVVSHVDLYGTGDDPSYRDVASALDVRFDKVAVQALRGVRVETWARSASR